ncbi:cyanophycinase [Flavihumibacter sp. RY-1]|uniref:Cyanophycinase n=1 Tax=Flavihumibacter fluminis TaxID=2909236 RepID=A0ABS9BF92_9BACT|nr:cyanophycinase [Flavihumibacter fluminis]MCF1713809.1 cyanophycinase [Flavihumibacter fluminis]
MKIWNLTFRLLLTVSFPIYSDAQNIQEDAIRIYLTGDSADVQTTTKPGLLLAGGSTDVNSAMLWLLERSGGGDVVVIRSSGADGYNQYLFELAKVNSVETILINNRDKAFLPIVAEKIRKAELLFIAGGDQWNYTRYWKDSPVEEAINFLINEKKVPVGGTSAGCAILGDYYFAAQYETIQSETALESPYHIANAIGRKDFIVAPILRNTITDSHYSQRNRQGRHISWLARLLQEEKTKTIRGIGVDEKTAVAIDEAGWATVFGSNEAWFVWNEASKPEVCEPGEALHWSPSKAPVRAYMIKGSIEGNGRFNLNNWKQMEGGTTRQLKVEQGVLR